MIRKQWQVRYTMKKNGGSVVYSQLYPFEGLWNYTSGIIHHVKIDGLVPETKHYNKCGDSSLAAMSDELKFETFPLPAPNKYPQRITVVGDLGLTSNTTTTIDLLTVNDPSMILMAGDLTYVNQYLTTGGKGASCYSCQFPDAPIRETYFSLLPYLFSFVHVNESIWTFHLTTSVGILG